MRHCPYLSGLFNRIPQCGRLGHTSAGAYVFLGNVALKALRVVNHGLVCKPAHFSGWVVDTRSKDVSLLPL